jgi:hypothetical protein
MILETKYASGKNTVRYKKNSGYSSGGRIAALPRGGPVGGGFTREANPYSFAVLVFSF